MEPSEQQAKNQFLDVDGVPIPNDQLHIDPSGQMFNLTQLMQIHGQWCYNGNPLLFDKNGVVITQYAAPIYRDPPELCPDDSPPGSSKQSDRRASDEQDLPLAPATGASPRVDVARKSSVANPPKMRDLSVGSISASESVTKRATALEDGTAKFADSFFDLAARLHGGVAVHGKAGKRRHIGYDAQELMLTGAIQCTPCRASNLAYAPHFKVFNEETFLDIPQDVFEILKPAVTLSENFIRYGNPQFWVDIACGIRIVDEQRTKTMGSRIETLYPVTAVTEEIKKQAWAKLQKMGEKLTIRFVNHDPAEPCYGSAQIFALFPHLHAPFGKRRAGEIWPSNQPLTLHSSVGPNPWDVNVTINLNDQFYVAAKAFAKMKYPDVGALLRFQFFFAVNLCHELAHCFEAKCGAGNYYDGLIRERAIYAARGEFLPDYPPREFEAKYKHYDPPETGWHFEAETFGGRVGPINDDYMARYGLALYQADGSRRETKDAMHEIAHGRPIGRIIPMGFVEELMQESYWVRPPNPNGITVPDYGAVTYLSTSSTTVSWRQYFKDKDALNFGSWSDIMNESFTSGDREPKRRRLKPPSPKPRKRRTANKPKRLLQPTIQKLPKKSDIEAAKMKADLIANAEKEEAEAAARAARERADAEAARQYRPPSPNQPAIDDKFEYAYAMSSKNTEKNRNCSSSSSSSSSVDSRKEPNSESYDPLTKPAGTHTIEDKWLLLEEYCCIVHGWDSAIFHAKRATNNLYPVKLRFLPADGVHCWGETELNLLHQLRAKYPERSLPVKQKQKRAVREANRRLWTTLNEMEELAAYKGFSRIAFQRSYSVGLPLPEGMTVQNFNEKFRSQLLAYREIEFAKQSAAYKDAVAKGEVVAPAESVLMPLSTAQHLAPTAGPEDALGYATQSNKITHYFHAPGNTPPSMASGAVTPEDDNISSYSYEPWVPNILADDLIENEHEATGEEEPKLSYAVPAVAAAQEASLHGVDVQADDEEEEDLQNRLISSK